MADFIEQFGKIPTNQKILATVIIYFIIMTLFYLLIYRGMQNNLKAARKNHAVLMEDFKKKQVIANNLDKFREDVDKMNEELKKALKELPNEREIPELLKRISSIGKKIGLEFLLFQPLPEIIQDFYAEVPVKLEIAGSYHEVAMFFDKVGKLSRIVNVEEIEMKNPIERSGKVILTTTGKSITYRFLTKEEMELKKVGEGEKGKHRLKK